MTDVDLPHPARTNADYWQERCEKAEALVEELAAHVEQALAATTSDSMTAVLACAALHGIVYSGPVFSAHDARATLAKVRKP